MAKLTPYIFSEDAKAQAEFYTQALGGEILSVQTHGEIPGTKEELKDKVMHLSLVAGAFRSLCRTPYSKLWSAGTDSPEPVV